MHTVSESRLLSLPYDIRFLIYQHLFPPGKQLYLQAFPTKTLKSITADHHAIPTPLLRVCRQLHSEASEFLYNNYLFNIVGRKVDCLALYGRFLRTLEGYANDEVHVDAFTNGWHSATMCVSIHTGEGKKGMLKRRERGLAKSIREVWEEVRPKEGNAVRRPSVADFLLDGVKDFGWMFAPGVAVLVALLVYVAVNNNSGR